ncbi:L-methionine/branched-chain amino acid transporter [uncultured Ferrimonas sp.]|uniref:L-methionine/branched-chain amino acid transporter n=1 Tax=uncultured Ferrimonas sp. TaxID=432640 RepID=UPI0026026920|nr:L-methionine/branched-chain amino acid transporter [uncultured Ferrimonas sp.]
MTQLTPTITRWQGVGLLSTALLGTSVFLLPQLTVKMAADGALLAWGILLLAMLPVALVFAKLGQRYPDAGGPATFVGNAFGERAGAAIGLLFLAVAPIGLPAAMMMTLAFADALVPMSAATKLALGLGLNGLMLALNYRGLQLSGKLQFGLTVVIMAIFALLALTHGDSLRLPQWPGQAMSPVLAATGVAMWAFLGIEAFAHLSAEFQDPKRDFLPAMMWGTVIVGLIYLLGTALVLDLGAAPLAMATLFDQSFGAGGAWVIGGLGVLAGFATMNTYFNSMARLLWSLAGQGYLPQGLAQLNSAAVPARSMWALALLQAGSLLLAYLLEWDFEHLLAPSNGIFVLVYLLAMLAGYRLLSRSFKWVAAFGAVLIMVLGYSIGMQMLYAVVALAVAIGLLWLQPKLKARAAPSGNSV